MYRLLPGLLGFEEGVHFFKIFFMPLRLVHGGGGWVCNGRDVVCRSKSQPVHDQSPRICRKAQVASRGTKDEF